MTYLSTVPDWFVQKFDSRRARVYVLEVVSQILAIVTLADCLGDAWVASSTTSRASGRSTKDMGAILPSMASCPSSRPWRHARAGVCRVCSEASFADPISRADCSLAIRHMVGSRRTHALRPFWRFWRGQRTLSTPCTFCSARCMYCGMFGSICVCGGT